MDQWSNTIAMEWPFPHIHHLLFMSFSLKKVLITSNGCVKIIIPWQLCWTIGPQMIHSGNINLLTRWLNKKCITSIPLDVFQITEGTCPESHGQESRPHHIHSLALLLVSPVLLCKSEIYLGIHCLHLKIQLKSHLLETKVLTMFVKYSEDYTQITLS